MFERKMVRIRFCRPDGTIYDVIDEVLPVFDVPPSDVPIGEGIKLEKRVLYHGSLYPVRVIDCKMTINVIG